MSTATNCRISFLLVATFLSAAGTIRPASAQSLPMAISPMRFEFAAYPGMRLKGTLDFWNGTDGPLQISMEISDFRPEDEEGHVTVGADEDASNSLKEWIRPDIPEVAVYPKVKIPLKFTIDIPKDAEPGTHWGSILVNASAPPGIPSGPAIQPTLGTIVLVDVYGQTSEALTLARFELPRFAFANPVTVALRFHNTGTMRVRPAGQITVTNLFGKTASVVDLPARNVLPGAIRVLDIGLTSGLIAGRYTAKIAAAYGKEGNGRIESEQSFWFFDARRILPSLLVFSATGVFFFVKRRNIRAAFRGFQEGPAE